MTQTQKLDYFERRRNMRVSVTRKARIALINAEIWKDCKILDESASGAQIEFHGELVANDEVTVEFAVADHRLATVRWFRGTKAGLELSQPLLTNPPIALGDIASDKSFKISPLAIERDDDSIITITQANIFVGEERMRFLGTPNVLTSNGLFLRQNLSEDTNTILENSLSYVPGSEGGHADGSPKLILTGKQAFELFEIDLRSLAISRNHLQERTDFRIALPDIQPENQRETERFNKR